MWDKKKITEAEFVLGTRSMNETHQTSAGFVAVVLVFDAVDTTI